MVCLSLICFARHKEKLSEINGALFSLCIQTGKTVASHFSQISRRTSAAPARTRAAPAPLPDELLPLRRLRLLPRHPRPLLPVLRQPGRHRRHLRMEERHVCVDILANAVDETDLRLCERVGAVHHGRDLDVLAAGQRPLEVALRPELFRQEVASVQLDAPGLRDGGEVGRGHHGVLEDRPVTEVGHEGRVTLGLEGDLVNDLCLLEVEREVGGEDASLDDAQRRFVVVL